MLYVDDAVDSLLIQHQSTIPVNDFIKFRFNKFRMMVYQPSVRQQPSRCH